MKARLLVKTKEIRDDGTITEIVIWSVSSPVPPCSHAFKYSLFYGRPGVRLVGYDNEKGKGDHRHFNGTESAYRFTTLAQLLDDFEKDIAKSEDIP
ncbi:MAG: toxin-antitoxin system TumE family protein [Pseudomonadota bacterium]